MSAKHWLWITFAVLVSWTGSASAQVSMAPSSLGAGNVLVGSMGTSPDGVLHSQMSGVNVDVVLDAASCSGGAGSFSLTSSVGSLTNINLNGDKTINATFSPTGRGTRTCTVNVFDSSGTPTTPLTTFTVSGTGIAPIITTTPVSTGTFTTVRFNNAAPVHASTLNVQVSNTGDTGTSLVVKSLSFMGGQTADYTVTSGTIPSAPLAAGQSTTYTITFDPNSPGGPSSTTLQISSDDPATMTKNIGLSGTGSTGVISVTDIAFGTIPIIGTQPSQNISVTNIGTGTKGPLGVTQAVFMNNSANWFRFTAASCNGSTTTCPLAMSITNTAATLGVQCVPPTSAMAGASQTAMIVFTSDTDDATDSIAQVSCTAGRADMTVDTTPLMFGDQLVNTPSTAKPVGIMNSTGNVALTYSLSLVGTDATQFIVTGVAGCTNNCSLAAMGSASVNVQCRPTSTGTKVAALRVTAANDPDTMFLDVPLSCNGVMPVSSPNPTSFAFGSIDVGDTATAQMLTVTNTGTYPLTLSAAYMFAGAADYVVTGTTGTSVSITLQPSQAATWTFACKPSVFGSRPGTFRLTSNHNGVAGTNQDIPMSCNGLQGTLQFIAPPANPFDFGGVREGDTRMQTFTLRNVGNAPVNNITVAFTGTGTGYTFAPTTISSLAGGAQATITVTFAPLDGTYGGLYTGTYSGTWGNSKTTMASQTVNGDGLTTGFDTLPSNPNALDFGDVRFDQTKTLNVNVINTAGTTLQIRGLSITPGTAQTGEFTVVGCTKNAIPITCPSMTTPYTSSGVNDTIALQIRIDPNNRVAMMDATLTITSDLAMNPTRTVMMKASSISAMIGLNPSTMVLDFGGVDLDSNPVTVTKMVTLTNTGAAPLDFSSVTKVGGPLGNVRFSFSATPAPFTLQPNGSYDIMVSYTPVVERPSNQPDTGSITFGGVAGVFGGPSSVTIMCTGYGIDRHIAVGPAPTFPDTYKNPGADAPVRPVTITNNGDAMLNVSAVMLTNDPIWALVNPDPVMVAGRQSYDFNVKFSPLMAGKAPTGRLTIMNNDNGMPIVTIDLDGNGLDRNIGVGPGTINLGYVGIGMSVKLSDITTTELLTVTNADSQAWRISDITIDNGDGAFEVTTLDGDAVPKGMEVAARTTATFDVVFTPTHEGDFSAQATVLIGDDPTTSDPQPAITLVGRGLYVDTGGGGGCSTGRGNGGGLALVLLALVLGRRRRGVLAALATLVGINAAHADDAENRNVSISLFDPTPAAQAGATFQLQGADVAEKGSLGVLTLVSYANQLLTLHTDQNDDIAVENRTTFSLGGVYSFGTVEVGAHMPFFVQNGNGLPEGTQRTMRFGIAPGGTARGDLTVHGKAQIGARGDVSYAVAGAITAPTASKDSFAGNELPTGRALFLLSFAHGPLSATLNAGAVLRAKATLGSATQGSGGVFGGGISIRFLDNMWAAGEIYGEAIPGGHAGRPTASEPMGPPELGTPIEGLLGLRYLMARTTSIGLAVGRGVTSDMGSPALRGVFSIVYTPNAEALKPLHPPRPPEPEKDADADGIKDELDQCPNEPEDKDLFNDADGCPDLDNDEDGLPDTADKCPLDPEDKDRFKDDDGCPDKDNDGDGVPDEQDRCPLAAEDKDGVEDTDGCPDPDDDHDGLLDSVDKCPKQPETINGNNDDDGCPDKGDSLIVLSPDRLETLESVTFNGAKLAKSSHNVLGQVGAQLRAHPEILRVRVTSHVQPSGNATADQKLSEQRAKAVRDWLVEWGVDPLRLQAAGFGGNKPLVPANSKGAAQINDRLEFIVLERK